jgi:hypothetical protein
MRRRACGALRLFLKSEWWREPLGDATRQQNGRIFSRRNLLATLREREVARTGAEMSASKAMPFRTATASSAARSWASRRVERCRDSL